MFSPARTSKLSQRALGALRLTRSFLLLEDDYDVDWEVDRDERVQAEHPHRRELRGRRPARRPGAGAPAPQHCVSPVGPAPAPAGRVKRRRRDLRAAGRIR